eukprot:COSAG05_NODE_538_length_8854_cov_306.308738_3_plen_84_part_00
MLRLECTKCLAVSKSCMVANGIRLDARTVCAGDGWVWGGAEPSAAQLRVAADGGRRLGRLGVMRVIAGLCGVGLGVSYISMVL